MHFGNAGAEGDEQFLLAGQEEAFGEGPLQADHGGDGAVEEGVGQQDDELLAAIAGDGILRADVLADHIDEVLERLVTGLVPVVVVDLLEIVHVQQAHAEGCATAAGEGCFAGQGFVEAFAVEYAC